MGGRAISVGRRRRVAARPSLYQRAVKPATDSLVCLAVLILCGPLLAAIAIAIRIESGTPVLFHQPRIGQHGRPFSVIRFRAVDLDSDLWRRSVADAAVEVRPYQVGVTRVGRLLLRTRLDRLPQLVNVLRGEMSLVGPRPALPYEAEKYRGADWIRLRVRPGLTCLWQLDHSSPTKEHANAMSSDYRYVAGISPWLDLAILVRTAVALLTGRTSR